MLPHIERYIGDLLQHDCYNSNKTEPWKIALVVKVVKYDLMLFNIDIYYINSNTKNCIKMMLSVWLSSTTAKKFDLPVRFLHQLTISLSTISTHEAHQVLNLVV